MSRRKMRVIEHGRCALRVKRSAASGCCVLPRRCASAALTQPHRLDHALTAGGHDLSLRYGAQVDRLRAHMQKQQELKKSLENRPTVPCVSLMCTPGRGSPPPHLHRDWARPCHICTGTGLAPCHICTGTAPGLGLTPSTAAPTYCFRKTRSAQSSRRWLSSTSASWTRTDDAKQRIVK